VTVKFLFLQKVYEMTVVATEEAILLALTTLAQPATLLQVIAELDGYSVLDVIQSVYALEEMGQVRQLEELPHVLEQPPAEYEITDAGEARLFNTEENQDAKH
jgi:hypothetical protein